MPESKNKAHQIKELIELNDELENYFRNTIIPQLFVDANLILRKFTPPAMKQFDLTAAHIGKPMEDLVDNIRFSTIMENIREVIDTEEIFEKEIQTDDRRWFQMNIIPYIVKKGNRVNGVIITFIDITDRIKVLRDLEKLNASHETFIYSVSHDLQAPLANIEGLINLLDSSSSKLMQAEGKDEEQLKNIIPLLESSVITMRSLISDLSDIAKIEGNFKETVETVYIDSIIKEAKSILSDKISESKAHISLELGVNEIDFSRKNIRSIIYNLISNAIKYRSSDSDPEIQIKTELANEFVLISVKDNGIGISKENQKHVFTPFTRFNKNVEGTGIGLYLIKKIVENEDGKVVFESEPGKGTEVKVYLKPKAISA